MAKYYLLQSSETTLWLDSMSVYYNIIMASSVSGQDELNPALWLATQVGMIALSVPQVKFPPNPLLTSLFR